MQTSIEAHRKHIQSTYFPSRPGSQQLHHLQGGKQENEETSNDPKRSRSLLLDAPLRWRNSISLHNFLPEISDMVVNSELSFSWFMSHVYSSLTSFSERSSGSFRNVLPRQSGRWIGVKMLDPTNPLTLERAETSEQHSRNDQLHALADLHEQRVRNHVFLDEVPSSRSWTAWDYHGNRGPVVIR